MSFGSPILRQHLVEFIVGTGVVIDGVTDNNYGGGGTSGPWTWTVPSGVPEVFIDAVSAGGGGGGGYNTGTSLSGGGGGCSGICLTDYKAKAAPLTNITVTIGAAGAGGAAQVNGTRGGSTSIVGFLRGFYPSYALSNFTLLGGLAGSAGAAGNGGGGGTLGNGSGASGGATSATPVAGTATNNVTELNNTYSQANKGNLFARRGAGGGGANTTVSSNGANGGANGGGGDIFNILYGPGGANSETINGGAGNTTGSISRGGGGWGGRSLFGVAGTPGAGGSAAANATGYGAGGSGGGGGAAGGNGSLGYVRFTYWSQD